jgi:ParB-like chromosome segregation protein Spo0J
MNAPKYQLLDPLTEQQYADLREDIAERGVLQPVIVDEFGEVIDGHHRKQIAEESGAEYPIHQLPAGLSEAEKLDASLALNLIGRHQTNDQKRATIRRYLLRRPDATDGHVGRLVGCDHKTVGRVRIQMESVGEIPQHSVRTGEDGRTYQARKPKTKPPMLRPDPEIKRQEELAKQRAKAAPKQAAKRAEQKAEEAVWRASHEAIGGSVREVSRPPARVLATQDRVKAALSECILALTRALQDPGMDADLIRAEKLIAPDFRLPSVLKKLRGLVAEFGAKLKELEDAEKASRIVRGSPVREQQ